VPRSLNMMIYYRDAFYQAYAATPTGKAEIARLQAQQQDAKNKQFKK